MEKLESKGDMLQLPEAAELDIQLIRFWRRTQVRTTYEQLSCQPEPLTLRRELQELGH